MRKCTDAHILIPAVTQGQLQIDRFIQSVRKHLGNVLVGGELLTHCSFSFHTGWCIGG